MNKLKTALKSTTILLAGLMLIFIAGYKTFADTSFSAGKYYYDQLDDDLSKQFYQLFYSNFVSDGKCKEMSSNPLVYYDAAALNLTVHGSGYMDGKKIVADSATQAKLDAIDARISNAVAKAYYAFSNDYAVVFWPTGYGYNRSCSLSYYDLSDITWTYTGISVSLTETYSGEVSEENIRTFNNGVDTVFNQIKSSLPSGASDYDKVKAIHDYLCNRLVYNGSNSRAHTAEGAFYGENKAVCEGYAEAFQILAERFGLTSVMVSGQAYNSSGNPEGHKWNMVRMEDGKWYLVDVTWDDQSGGINYTYMLSGKNSNGFNSKQGNERADDGLLTYPAWNSTAYTQHTHSLALVPAKAPTCDEDGYEAYYRCSGCGRMFSDPNGADQITVPVTVTKLGHDWDEGTITTEPGCETEGVRSFHCTRDGCTGTKTEPVTALGHSLELHAAKAATCTEDGHEAYYECSRCHKLFSDADGKNEISSHVVITKLGHKLKAVAAKAPTKTEPGNCAYYECERCGKLFSDAEGKIEIPDRPHFPCLH